MPPTAPAAAHRLPTGAPRPPHRRILADAHSTRGGAQTDHLSNADFATLRLRLLKLGARVIETVSRIRLAFAAACPEASLFRKISLSRCSPQHHAPGHQGPAEPKLDPPARSKVQSQLR
ncbi:transposase [Mesorhizobium sp. L2C085B000]|uniref:transposase n=1 Tax=Mesorhizobium sp. L2C085B000 TaxID=1287117 RepID=UPI0032AFD0CE